MSCAEKKIPRWIDSGFVFGGIACGPVENVDGTNNEGVHQRKSLINEEIGVIEHYEGGKTIQKPEPKLAELPAEV